MLAFGLVHSWWAVLAVPSAVLIGLAFAGAGAAGSTYIRSWFDFDFINLALLPMFLFSGTFFPMSRYPDWLRVVVRCTPLYQGVALERALALGHPTWASIGHALYLAALGLTGMRIAARRLTMILSS